MKDGSIFGFFGIAVLLALVFAVFPGFSRAGADAVSDLATAYEMRKADRDAARQLRATLEREAGVAKPAAHWDSLVNEAKLSSRERAARGLALLRLLCPEGDASRWGEVSGFLDDPMLPKPLMVFDAVFYAVQGLVQMADPGAAQLAQDLLKALASSSKAKVVAFVNAPEGTKTLLSVLDGKTALPAFGGWGQVGEGMGSLPFARPVRGVIGLDAAQGEGMTFLDTTGRPAAGGPYAWDRRHGKILRVVDRRGLGLFWWLND